MNTIDFTFNRIILTVADPRYRDAIPLTFGSVKDLGAGRYELALSQHNLKRIAEFFPEGQKAVVRNGRQFLDQLKSKFALYKKEREAIAEICARDRYPVEPNGKFAPYAHQTKIIGIAKNSSNSAILADCGTGKTGSLARAIELEIAERNITPGKVLVTAPLSILRPSWMADVQKFTNLRPALLWTPVANKTLKGERRFIKDLGAAPEGTVSKKNKKFMAYVHNKTMDVLRELSPLHFKEDWTKMEITQQVAIALDGSEHPFGELTGRPAEKEKTKEAFIRQQLGRSDVDVFIINHDGVRIYREILKEHGFEWVIIDESSKIKNATSQLFKAHCDISWKTKKRNILSGTPNPNGFEDLWSQFYFLDRGMTLEPVKKDFVREYFTQISLGERKVGSQVKKMVKNVLRGETDRDRLIERVRSVGICIEQRDCIDLPPRTDMHREVYMSRDQSAAYREMEELLVTQLIDLKKGMGILSEATNVLSKIMRLRQITSGFLRGEGIDDGAGTQTVKFEHNPKLEELENIVEELGDKKVVVSCQFGWEIDAVLERFKDLGAECIRGGISVDRRTESIRRFQADPDCRMIVLQPAAAAHGITLTASNYLVFMSTDYNFDSYYQVAKRIERIGQKHPIFVLHVKALLDDGSSTIDEIIQEALDRKSRDRASLFASVDAGGGVEHLAENIIEQHKQRRN